MAFPSLVTLYQIAILLSFGYFDLLKLQLYNIKISLNNRKSIFLNLRLVRNITLVLSYDPMPFTSLAWQWICIIQKFTHSLTVSHIINMVSATTCYVKDLAYFKANRIVINKYIFLFCWHGKCILSHANPRVMCNATN